ncbi:MAG TPA: hypothetical protein VK150_06675, partial [Geothrix sp.]|nr:hypothetical protein [Geothrix sp.]
MTIRRQIPTLALAALCMLLPSRAQAPAVVPQPATIDGASAHVYKTIRGTELRLHVFSAEPAAPAARRPAIVFFFGGGWS